MTLIQDIQAREILDARGLPTLEAEVTLNCGALGRASIPAFVKDELRDKDNPRFAGHGVSTALEQIRDRLCLVLRGLDALDQNGVDREIANINRISSNARLVTSLAVAQAAAIALEIPLYRYLAGVNAKHAPLPMPAVLENLIPANAPFSQLLLQPLDAKQPYDETLRMLAEISYQADILAENKPQTPQDCLDLIQEAIEKANYSPSNHVAIAVQLAQNANDTIDKLVEAIQDSPLSMILFNHETASQTLVEQLNNHPEIILADCAQIGDDNAEMPRQPNHQVVTLANYQTLTDCLDHVQQARFNARHILLNAQKPGTDDTFDADLAIALNAKYLLAGSLKRFDAVAKYNQLLRLAL